MVSQRLISFLRRHRTPLAGALVLAVAVCALYLPFLSNPLVFDDRGYFTGREFAQYAMSPFGLRPRFPAAFSLASVYVVFGTVEAQRVVSLLLHLGTTLAVFWLVRVSTTQRLAPALAAAAFFGLHPVSVYGAAYLAQRSIVLATLFAVLSIAVFARGISLERYAYVVGAAVLFCLAVLSKEHAMVLAAIAPAAAWAFARNKSFATKYTLAYVIACIPVSVFIYFQVKGMRQAELLGQALEPQFADIAAQVGIGAGDNPLARSALTQAMLFFRYLGLWAGPTTSRMSLDLRVDFEAAGLSPLAVAATAGYIGAGLLAAFLVLRRGRWALAGVGLWWVWVFYLLEFSVVRFQEPFVLYRGYIWAPGIALVLAALIERVPVRIVVPASLVVAAALAWQAHDRLRTFSSGLALWEDAVAKLPAHPVPGGVRPLYELGREYFYNGQPEKALQVVERCLAQYPEAQQCAGARVAMLLESGQYEAALPYLERAIAERPDDGLLRHHLGLALERLGCRQHAAAQYRISAGLGYGVAAQRLQSLENPGQGVVQPSKGRTMAASECAGLLKNLAEPRR